MIIINPGSHFLNGSKSIGGHISHEKNQVPWRTHERVNPRYGFRVNPKPYPPTHPSDFFHIYHSFIQFSFCVNFHFHLTNDHHCKTIHGFP